MASVRISYTVMVLDRLNTALIKELYGRDLKYGKIDGRIRTWYNPNLDSQNFFVPGIVAFVVMLISLLMTSIAIIKERENGTMEQLIVTPLKPIELIIGKTIPYTIIAIAQMVMVMLFALFWFDVPLAGSVPALFLATCLFLLSTLGVGLFISTVSKTQQQAMMTTFFFILPFFMLSGLRLSHRQHARDRPVVDIPQPFALFSRHHPGNLPQGGGAAHPLAPVRGPGGSRHRGLRRGGGTFPETAGLRKKGANHAQSR